MDPLATAYRLHARPARIAGVLRRHRRRMPRIMPARTAGRLHRLIRRGA